MIFIIRKQYVTCACHNRVEYRFVYLYIPTTSSTGRCSRMADDSISFCWPSLKLSRCSINNPSSLFFFLLDGHPSPDSWSSNAEYAVSVKYNKSPSWRWESDAWLIVRWINTKCAIKWLKRWQSQRASQEARTLVVPSQFKSTCSGGTYCTFPRVHLLSNAMSPLAINHSIML